MFELGVKHPIDAPESNDCEVLGEVAEACGVIKISGLRHMQDKIETIERYAEAANDCGDRMVVNRLHSLLYVIGERVISEESLEDELVKQAISTLGNIMRRIMNDGRLLSDRTGLVRSGVLAIEYLRTKGTGSKKHDVKEWAIHQLQRISEHPSEIGRQLEANVRASVLLLED